MIGLVNPTPHNPPDAMSDGKSFSVTAPGFGREWFLFLSYWQQSIDLGFGGQLIQLSPVLVSFGEIVVAPGFLKLSLKLSMSLVKMHWGVNNRISPNYFDRLWLDSLAWFAGKKATRKPP